MARYVRGTETVDRVFRSMPRDLTPRLARALNRSGAEMAAAASILAPRSQDGEHVAEDVGHDLVERGTGGAVSVVVYAGTMRETRPAALRSEFGRQPGGEGIEGHPGHRAQPFFFVAYRAVRKRARRRVRSALRRIAKAAQARV